MSAIDAVVVAAGRSSRMGGGDKLIAPLLGRPLLAWSLAGIAGAGVVERIVLVAPARRARALAAEEDLPEQVLVVEGGKRRQESVAAGVRATAAPVVLIHDGARPLVSSGLVRRVAEAARRHGAAIPVTPVAETVKRVANGVVVTTLARGDLALAQTPQGFRRDLLERAWAAHPPEGPETWTDEAALLETSGIAVHAVAGEDENLKVTRPADLARAADALARREGCVPGARLRSGLGRDSHPFGPGDGLALGGIRIPEAPTLHGHSDGDVALHAVADALLGASALGDLGRLFPPGDPATRGIPSGELLRSVVERIRRAGFEPISLDVTVIGARPHLGSERLEAMRSAIARLAKMPPSAVAVKASSGNLSGDEGAGRAIAAWAVALVRSGDADR